MTLGEKIDNFIERMKRESQETYEQRLKQQGVNEWLEQRLKEFKNNDHPFVHIYETDEGRYQVKVTFEE